MWVRLTLAYHQVPVRLQYPVNLAERTTLVRDFAECGHEEYCIEGRVWKGQETGVANMLHNVVNPQRDAALSKLGDHFRLDLHCVKLPMRRQAWGDSKAVVGSARANLQDAFTSLWLQDINERLSPHKGTRHVEPGALAEWACPRVAANPDEPGRHDHNSDQ